MINNGAVVHIYTHNVCENHGTVRNNNHQIIMDLSNHENYSLRSLAQRNLHVPMEYSQLFPWKFQ